MFFEGTKNVPHPERERSEQSKDATKAGPAEVEWAGLSGSGCTAR